MSFVFEGKNVKICGHETGFDYFDKFDDFFKCFENLIKIKGLNLKVSGLSLTFSNEKPSLNSVESTDDYFKTVKFWTLVKDHAAFFGITEENKFEIEKIGSEGSETVKINGFESSLPWRWVVNEDNKTFIESNGGWLMFKLKDEEPKAEDAKNKVKIEWNETSGYKLDGASDFTKIDSLNNLEQLVTSLNGNTGNGNEGNFTLGFDDKKVKVCGGQSIDITSGENFKTLLGYVTTLKGTNKAINSGVQQIQIASSKKILS